MPAGRLTTFVDAAIGFAYLGAIWAILHHYGVKLAGDPSFVAGVAGSAVLASVLGAWFTRSMVRKYTSWRERTWTEAARQSAQGPTNSERLGIERVYDTMQQALPDFTRDLSSAKDVRLLLQIGTYMLGGARAVVYKTLKERRTDNELRVRILLASTNSPMFSPERFRERGSNLRAAQTNIDYVSQQTAALRDDFDVRLEVRHHEEPFQWILCFVDDAVYVIGYFLDHKNQDRAPVYKLVKTQWSLYHLFEKHFEDMWSKYPPGSGKK
jgi:hypothetical protein